MVERLTIGGVARAAATALVAAALGLLGCGEDGRAPSAPHDGVAGAAGPGGGGGEGGTAPACAPPEPEPLGQKMQIDTATAILIDQSGALAADVQCTVCGTDICSGPALSEPDGEVLVTGPGLVQSDPRFNVGYNGRDYARMSALIPAAPVYDFGTVRVLRMPPFGEGTLLVAGSPAESGGVTLEPAAGASIAIDILLYQENERGFRAALFDIRAVAPAELPAVDPALGIELLIGTLPLDTTFCPAASMRFDNVIGWPAGAEVEILMNGTKTYQHQVPWGQWAAVASAVVDPDGQRVTTTAAIAALGTFGARLK